jgi:hypothetical protein
MLEQSAFDQLANEIAGQGYDEDSSARLAMLVGDTPAIDEAGRVIVMEQGKEVARLRPLRFFGGAS